MADKSKVSYQEDDYGVEVYVKKDEETKKPEPEKLDEDALYEQQPKVEVGEKPKPVPSPKEEVKSDSKLP